MVLEVLKDIYFPRPYLVLKKLSNDSTSHNLTDNIDLPFVDDPAVIGKWTSVGAAMNVSDFDPANPLYSDAMYLKSLSFAGGGAISANNEQTNSNISWTKGAVLNRADQTASAYTIKDICGSTYMFFEWKTGDYTYLHMKPGYFVLEKIN
jgi:bla regulator protein BlaR1